MANRLTTFGNDLYTGKRSFNFVGGRKKWYAIAGVAFSMPAIWNCDPPRNSMLKLTPRSTGMSTVRMISTPAIAYHFLRPPTKLNERLPV